MKQRLGLALLAVAWFTSGSGEPQTPPPVAVLDALYRADEPFPQYVPFWREQWSLKDAAGETLQYTDRDTARGGSVHIYLRNNAPTAIEFSDVLLEGIGLKRAIAFSSQQRKREFFPASIYFSNINAEQRDRLLAAGEPIWWRIAPKSTPPGGVAEIAVRLRSKPHSPLHCTALTGAGKVAVTIRPGESRPRMAAVRLSPSRDTVWLFARSRAPAMRVSRDGVDITQEARLLFASSYGIASAVVRCRQPETPGELHCWALHFEAGPAAVAALRLWPSSFTYGIWGYGKARGGDDEAIQRYLNDWANHNVNTHMGMSGSALNEFFKQPASPAICRRIGLHRVLRWPLPGWTPTAYFLMDEPDCADYRVGGVSPLKRVGCMAQSLVDRSRELRELDPTTPQLLNVDLTYKPDNWRIYGQVPDILAADPYYINRLRDAYWSHPERLPLYTKATYVYAIGELCRSSAEPRPFHLILNSVRHTEKKRRFRYSTPEEKRIEAYYAVGAGATGISYWWYTPIGTYHGVGSGEADAQPLWREIGLLGAELGTAGPVLNRACPAPAPVKASGRVWVRSLVTDDAVVLVCVNDDYASDRAGTVVEPIPDASVTVTAPSWIRTADVFEISAGGVRSVSWQSKGKTITVGLGKLAVTRLIIVSATPGLRGELQARYDALFATKVAALRGERDHGRR